MAEHNHHDHDHGHGCCGHDHGHHEHDDGLIVGGGMSGAHADTAAKSLADALRWSFAILTGIMILVVIGFLLTGVKRIEAQEVGVMKVFGRIVDTVGPGLAYTWPFPVGEIEKVSTMQQSMEIDDFWMDETPEDKAQPDLSKRRPMSPGLRPGYDGALFAGDRTLIHIKLECLYVIGNARDFKMNVPDKHEVLDPLTQKMRSVDPGRDLIRTALCNAAIHAASTRTADNIQKYPGAFLGDVRLLAQRQLDELRTGIRIDNVNFAMTGISWPLLARGAYDAAQAAASKKKTLISQALNDARSTLISTAGSDYAVLVGDPAAHMTGAAETLPEGDYDLIGQYSRAREQGDAAKAEALLSKIDEVLVSRSTEGTKAGQSIKSAINYANSVKLTLEARARQFEKIKDEYLKAPQFMMDSLWSSARQDILTQPSILKFYIGDQGDEPMVIKINHDQEFLKMLREEMIKNPEQGPR